MSDQKRDSIIKFLKAVYKRYQLLTFEKEVFYHYGKGEATTVIKYFDQFSFPSIATVSKLRKLSVHLYVLIASNILKREIYGAIIMIINRDHELELISFAVHPEFRNKNYGTRLMWKVEELARTMNMNRLSVVYRSYWRSNEYWNRILDKTGWTEPEVRLHYFSFRDIKTQFHKDWFQNAELPVDYELEKWKGNSLGRLKMLLTGPDWEGVVPKALNPFQYSELILPSASFLLLKNGEITGWLIGHLMKPDTVQITTLFTHPNKTRGIGLKFLAVAMKLLNPNLRYVFMVQNENRIMLNMIHKRMADENLEQSHQLRRIKEISKT